MCIRDRDGSFELGRKSLTVNNVAPTQPTLGDSDSTDEGASYTLGISGVTDPAGTNDPLSYEINWGDGTAVQNLTAAELAALGGNVPHTFADDADGAADNATTRTVTVTVRDGDGGISSQSKVVTVNNVAPTASVTGNDTVNEGTAYTLSVGTIVEPGADTRTGYSLSLIHI